MSVQYKDFIIIAPYGEFRFVITRLELKYTKGTRWIVQEYITNNNNELDYKYLGSFKNPRHAHNRAVLEVMYK